MLVRDGSAVQFEDRDDGLLLSLPARGDEVIDEIVVLEVGE